MFSADLYNDEIYGKRKSGICLGWLHTKDASKSAVMRQRRLLAEANRSPG